jgi:hypothetical protein
VAIIVSILGALTALLCAVLLMRGWGLSRQRLLLWSGLCFAGLTASNALLVLNQLQPAHDLYLPRLLVAVCAMLLLVFGLVWEAGEK